MFSSNTSQVVATSTQAEAVDYDSTNDYLSRSTYYNGYVNALTFLKETFTFSCWFYNGESTGNAYVFSSGASSGNANLFYVNISTTAFQIRAYDGSGTFILNATTTNTLPLNTFCNLIVSCDMTSTANRYVYVNDQLMTMTWSNYVNSTIQFGTPIQRINSLSNSVDPTACRISNVFLDFTYRDLSITANRRLFVTADLKPAAGQAALSPILYLPMSNPTTVGTNAGTGGNFTLNGTIARSGRGPNQYNAPYSDLDGTADYLSRTTAPSGIADGKQLTVSGVFNFDSTAGRILVFSQSTNYKVEFALVSGKLTIECKNAAGSTVLSVTANQTLVANRNYQFVLSCDMTDSAKRWLKINGEDLTNVWSTYTNDNINFNISSTPRYLVGATSAPAATFNGRLGALWFNTSYIDLSVASNLAKFVSGTGIDAKPVDLGATGELPTGTAPIMYLPMYGNNAGKNYGTGGDFTAVSGPYTGARGPNEFWGNKADFNGTTGRLTKSSALTGVSDGKTISGSFWVMFDNASTNVRILTEATGSSNRLLITRTSGNALQIGIFNSSGGDVVNVSTIAGIFSSGTQYSVQFCFDVTNAAKRKIYINSEDMTLSVAAYNNQDMVFSGDNWTFGALYTGTYSQYLDGKLSEFYLTTEYIDFSQEANRLKFRDCFGYPTDLPSAITALSVPNPAIYMRFPPTSFGTNSGTGGDFTVNGTITDGGQL